MPVRRPPGIALVCSGIGRVRRGMEHSVAGMHAELRGSLDADWHLLAGGGAAARDHHALPMVGRERVPRVVTRLRPSAAIEIEQATFFASSLPTLMRLSPAVIYCRDRVLVRLLAASAALLSRGTRVIYGNGSPEAPPYPKSIALVHHLTQHAYGEALAAGEPSDRQRHVPNAFPIPRALSPADPDVRRALRQGLGLPPDGRVLLCAAAINRYHKRVDHLISEVARCGDQRIALVLVGEHEAETPSILAAGRAALGARLRVTRADASAMDAYYRAADALVLPSLVEAFGRVIVEALAVGLPVILHHGPSFREIAGPHAVYVDMARPGELARALAAPEVWRWDPETAAVRHRWSYARYSWDRLKPRYLEMFATCLERSREADRRGPDRAGPPR